MKTISLSAVFVAIGTSVFAVQSITHPSDHSVLERLQVLSEEGRIVQSSVTCFKTGEQTSGMNKICYYDCLGSAAAITISSVQLCPLSIKR